MGYSSAHCIKIVYSSGQCIKIGYSSAQCMEIGNAPNQYRGWGCSQRWGGSFVNVGCTTSLIHPDLDRVFGGLHILLLVRMKYYGCG